MSETNLFSEYLIERNASIKKLIRDTSKMGGIDEASARFCNQKALRSVENKKELTPKNFANQTYKERLAHSREIAQDVNMCVDSMIPDGKQKELINNMTNTTYKMIFGV